MIGMTAMVGTVRLFLASTQRRLSQAAAAYFSSSSFMMAARCNTSNRARPLAGRRQAQRVMHVDAMATGWIAVAAISGSVAAIARAFAGHALDPIVEANALDCLITGSLYGGLHALAIVALVLLTGAQQLDRKLALTAAWLFLTGSILFPGALYGLALHGPRWLGAVAPVGLVALILGWVSFAFASLTHRSNI